MKKLIAVALGLLLSVSAMGAHGPAGCGLGALLLGEKEGLIFNVLAGTTNASSGTQTFGMSTGTLGCEDAKMASVAAVSFIDNNLVALSNDIANGSGQTLNAYLTLINASNVNNSVLRSNFASIFADNATATTIHASITSLI